MNKVRVNGVELAYERSGAGRVPLVLVHGYPLDHSIWKEVLPLLETDFDVVLPDLRGFGQSELVQVQFTLRDMAADILGLLDHLNIDKAVVAGHSMGGYISLAFARDWPERVAGLGLIATQAQADTPERKQARYTAADGMIGSGVKAVAQDMPPKLTPDERVRVFVRDLIAKQRPVGLVGALKAMATREDAMMLLAMFRFPVVVIHGKADVLIPVERARDIQEAFPKAHLVELTGVGHMPMMEAPLAVAEALRALT
jgi:3-oxoadipate enol-lactonase